MIGIALGIWVRVGGGAAGGTPAAADWRADFSVAGNAGAMGGFY